MRFQEKKARLLVYTRKVLPGEYPDGLARSIHLAYSRDGSWYQPLHENYGILFARGTISQRDTIVPKGVKDPRVFQISEGVYGISAVRVNEDGTRDLTDDGKMLLWITEDFIHFDYKGLVKPAAQKKVLEEQETELPGLPSGTIPGNSIEISAGLCDDLVRYWSRIYNTRVEVPDCIKAGCEQDISGISADVIYSDGSGTVKKVCWDTKNIDFKKKGTYRIKGTVQNEQFTFPLACGYGDPVIFPWKGKYYFVATNDNKDDVGIYVREADNVAGLFKAPEHLILDRDEEGIFWQTFWAPEFHVIGGHLYILFAVSSKVWGPQCHLMRLKENGDILKAEDWESPIRIRRQDKSWLSEDGITLDMTYLKAGERSYVIWSYRRNIGTPDDTGSMLYIATVDEKTPWILSSEPVLLSRPLFGWENVSGTINNEGPYSFVKDGRVYLTYSGGAADSYTYVLGLLTADEKDDLLKVSSWKKSGFPVLSFYSVEGEYGPGHNSFFVSEEGNLMIAYHAEEAIDHGLRSDGIRRVHFAVDKRPVFDMSAERDLDPKLKEVSMKVIVEEKEQL